MLGSFLLMDYRNKVPLRCRCCYICGSHVLQYIFLRAVTDSSRFLCFIGRYQVLYNERTFFDFVSAASIPNVVEYDEPSPLRICGMPVRPSGENLSVNESRCNSRLLKIT